MRGQPFFVRRAEMSLPYALRRTMHTRVATPTGKSLHSTPFAQQFGLLPSPSLCATGSSAQEKSNGVKYKKRSNLLSCFLVVGAEGFEPPTLCL